MNTTEIQIVLEILIVIIGFYLAFFKSYFQEKGKNLATKEDIEEITRKVENIKNEFIYSTQTKINLKTEERNSLVNCYEKYNYWLNTILDCYFGGINEENKSKLTDIKEKLDEAKFQYEIAEGRVGLFVNNKEISELRKQLKIGTLELQHINESYIGKIEYLFFEITQMKATIPIGQQIEPYRVLLEKRTKLHNDYNQEKLDKFKDIAPLSARFQGLIYKHLLTLIEK